MLTIEDRIRLIFKLITGVVIGYVTIMCPDRSPGPIGLLYALAFIFIPMLFFIRYLSGKIKKLKR